MVQDVGNVDLFELFETDPQTQCKECLSYWSEGIVDCTCGHLLNETVANRCFIKKRTFLELQSTQLRKEVLIATDVGKLQKRMNIIWSVIWKRDASRGSSHGSMIVSCEIMIFVKFCTNTIEMKMFVVNGGILQNKISPIECQNQTVFITDTIGGSLSISVETLADHWENVLTPTNHCLH